MTTVSLIHYPSEAEWMECKQRACITMGLKAKNAPSTAWKMSILEARHSPIRVLRYSFLIKDIPSNTATHFARHVHAQPYISSLRNDRQEKIDGDNAPRNSPVDMILDVNAEELMVMANKRLCQCAAEKTREVMSMMCEIAKLYTPEIGDFLVPMCEYHGGVCHEMQGCGMHERWKLT